MSNDTVREAPFGEFLEKNSNATTFYFVQVITFFGLSSLSCEIIFGCWENLSVIHRKFISCFCKYMRILLYQNCVWHVKMLLSP